MHSIDLDNQTGLSVPLDLLDTIAAELCQKEIELIITDNKNIAKLNTEHRGKESATDVLSFPLTSQFESQFEGLPLGSIVISADFVVDKAEELGHSEENELTLLFIHGLLHLLGYDHEVDHGEMRQKEKEIIHLFGLPSSLILRTEEL